MKGVDTMSARINCYISDEAYKRLSFFGKYKGSILSTIILSVLDGGENQTEFLRGIFEGSSLEPDDEKPKSVHKVVMTKPKKKESTDPEPEKKEAVLEPAPVAEEVVEPASDPEPSDDELEAMRKEMIQKGMAAWGFNKVNG